MSHLQSPKDDFRSGCQVVETSVTNNSSFQNYRDNHTIRTSTLVTYLPASRGASVPRDLSPSLPPDIIIHSFYLSFTAFSAGKYYEFSRIYQARIYYQVTMFLERQINENITQLDKHKWIIYASVHTTHYTFIKKTCKWHRQTGNSVYPITCFKRQVRSRRCKNRIITNYGVRTLTVRRNLAVVCWKENWEIWQIFNYRSIRITQT